MTASRSVQSGYAELARWEVGGRKTSSMKTVLLALLLGGYLVQPLLGCSMVHIRSAEELCREAEAIVVAVPERYRTQPVELADGGFEYGRVEFEVQEVVKGQIRQDVLLIEGELTSDDDYNDGRVPYDFVRDEGRGGSCFAKRYRRSARFLLFLVELEGELSPYWSGLAATNEQLAAAGGERWLRWTRSCVRSLEDAG